MEVNSTFIHANNLFGGEQNCRLESDYWHFYIFGTVSVLQVSNLEIKRCIDGTKDHQGYYADLSCKKYFIYYLKSHDWKPADGVAGSQESSKVNSKICRTKTTLKPLSRCQSQTLQRYFFLYLL